ncbi:MAG: ChrR family anti-sigma-E factor [Albidovulum sp.]
MTEITHHVPDALLASFAAGSLAHAFSTVVAAHVSLCSECRAQLEAHQALGGAILETHEEAKLSADIKTNVMALLDAPAEPQQTYHRSGIFPGPVMAALKGKPPRWKSLGLGVRQSILAADEEGSVRLLFIPPGQAVPDHSHNGLELTLVLQGSFSDETGRFAVGDLEVADEHLEHTPKADLGEPCICLAATDSPLRFTSFVPRLLQPLFRI